MLRPCIEAFLNLPIKSAIIVLIIWALSLCIFWIFCKFSSSFYCKGPYRCPSWFSCLITCRHDTVYDYLSRQTLSYVLFVLLGCNPLTIAWRRTFGAPWLSLVDSGCLALLDLFDSSLVVNVSSGKASFACISQSYFVAPFDCFSFVHIPVNVLCFTVCSCVVSCKSSRGA